MPVSMDSRRCTNCSALISRLKKADDLAVFACRVQGEVHCQAGFAHAGPGRQDDQIRLLEAAQQLVQLGKAAGHAQDLALVAVQKVDAIHDLVHHLAHGHQVAADAPLGDIEDELLGRGPRPR